MGVSRDTIKRRLKSGAFPNAYRGPGSGPGGPWRIPITDVDASGLSDPNGGIESDDLISTRMHLAVATAEIRLLRAHLADLQRVLARSSGTN